MQTDLSFGYRLMGSPLEAERCLQCHDAPCAAGCPAGVDVKRFIGLIQKGEYGSAADVIERDNPLGLICGYTCPTAETCQKNCVSARLGKPIDIRALQSYTIELSREMGNQARRNGSEDGELRFNRGDGILETKPFKAGGCGNIAIVGSGPAGLSAAWYLRKLGYGVELIEESDHLGGRLVQGIPPFRVDPTMVHSEIADITRGMHIRCGVRLGSDVTVQGLLESGFRGVVLATGKYLCRMLSLEGCGEGMVYKSEEILNESGWKQKCHREAVVIGAGNVAMDTARTLVRGGVDKVHICYRGSNYQVKATQEEREDAYQDGIALHLFSVPVAIETESGRMTGIRFRRSNIDRNTDGKVSYKLLGDAFDFVIPADMVVLAIGFGVREEDLIISSITLENGAVRTNEFATDVPGVYAAGDLIGRRTIVQAVGDGKGAAVALHEYLMKGDRK